MDKNNDENGLLNAMRPMPAEFAKDNGWYNWRVTNWGTKWDISTEGLEFIELDHGRARIAGSADSAWSPPIEAFQAYANENLDTYLEIRYFEPGMSFIGVWDSEGRDAYWEDVGSLILQEAENDDDVPMDLMEHFNVWNWYDFPDLETETAE